MELIKEREKARNLQSILIQKELESKCDQLEKRNLRLMAKVKSLKEHKSMTNQGVQTINESIETPSKLLKKKDELISKLKNEIDISTTDIQRLNTDLIHYERVVDELGFVSLFLTRNKTSLRKRTKTT